MCFNGLMIVEASDIYISSYDADESMSVKTKNAIFTLKLSQNENGSGSRRDIEIEKEGTREVIISDIYGDFVTNGKNIYYTKHTKPIDDYSWKNTICCYDIKSGKKTKIISGTDYCVMGCSGKYLYYGAEIDYGIEGVSLYAFNVKTKKKKHLTDFVSNITVSNGKILTNPFSGELWNFPIYVFNSDGSGKKRIDDGCAGTIKNGKIYYYKADVKNNKYRLYKCSLTGKNKTALTGWTNEIPKMFRTWQK